MTGPRYKVQRPELSVAMARLYGLKGDARVEALSEMSPSLIVGNIDETPYGSLGRPVANYFPFTAGGAGNFRIATVVAGAGLILQVRRLIIKNTTGGNLAFRIQMRAHSVGVASTLVANLGLLGDIEAGSVPLYPTFRPSFLGQDITAALPTGNPQLFPDLLLTAGTHIDLAFPADLCPFFVGNVSNAGTGTGCLTVIATTANLGFELAVHGKEFQLGG